MTIPNWPSIFRDISESIEPKPTSNAHALALSSRWQDGNTAAWKIDYDITEQRWTWQPHDWREPAAAVSLFERMAQAEMAAYQDASLSYIEAVRLVGQAILRIMEQQPMIITITAAIVLAFHAMIQEKA